MRRRDLAFHLRDLVGDELLSIIDARDGWPSLAAISTESHLIQISLHVGPIGLSQRERDAIERRFQNPGSDRPIVALPNTVPVLIGVFEEGDASVLVGMDASHRLGRTTRFSLFMPLWTLRAALANGWVEHYNSVGERIYIFRPNLLPIYVELVANDVDIDSKAIQAIIASGAARLTGVSEDERQRRLASQLIRDSRFSRDVCRSYSGLCAMCGLNFSLVVGAHIYPAAATGSQDKIWNGIALCQNHHAAFDSHRIFVRPDTRMLVLHPSLKQHQGKPAANEAFVATTYARLSEPVEVKNRPRTEMFSMRYAHFSPKYEWVV